MWPADPRFRGLAGPSCPWHCVPVFNPAFGVGRCLNRVIIDGGRPRSFVRSETQFMFADFLALRALFIECVHTRGPLRLGGLAAIPTGALLSQAGLCRRHGLDGPTVDGFGADTQAAINYMMLDLGSLVRS